MVMTRDGSFGRLQLVGGRRHPVASSLAAAEAATDGSRRLACAAQLALPAGAAAPADRRRIEPGLHPACSLPLMALMSLHGFRPPFAGAAVGPAPPAR